MSDVLATFDGWAPAQRPSLVVVVANGPVFVPNVDPPKGGHAAFFGQAAVHVQYKQNQVNTSGTSSSTTQQTPIVNLQQGVIAYQESWGKQWGGSSRVVTDFFQTTFGTPADVFRGNDTEGWPSEEAPWSPAQLHGIINISVPRAYNPATDVVPHRPAQFFVDQTSYVVTHSYQNVTVISAPSGPLDYRSFPFGKLYNRFFVDPDVFMSAQKSSPRTVTDFFASSDILLGNDTEGWPPFEPPWSPSTPASLTVIGDAYPAYPFANDTWLLRKPDKTFQDPETFWAGQKALPRSVFDIYRGGYDVIFFQKQSKVFPDPDTQWGPQRPLGPPIQPAPVYVPGTDVTRFQRQAKEFGPPEVLWSPQRSFLPSVLVGAAPPPYNPNTDFTVRTKSQVFVDADTFILPWKANQLVLNGTGTGATPVPPGTFIITNLGGDREVILYPKLGGEAPIVPVDFISRLQSNESITSASISGTLYSGTGSFDLSLGTPVIAGTVVETTVTGGTVGNTYELLYKVTTSLGQTLELAGYYTIIPDLV